MQTILSFDFGMKRIGVAVGQFVTRSANPLTTLKAVDGIPNWDNILKLIDEWHADALVVGLPLNMDGTWQHTSYASKKFANRLHAKFKLPVFTVDERLTSVQAKRDLKREKQLDSYAAKLILESWFSNQPLSE